MFLSVFVNLLNVVNFEKVINEDLEVVLNEELLFKVCFVVSFEDFEDVVFYWWGELEKIEMLCIFFGLWKK